MAKYYDWKRAEERARQAQRSNLLRPTEQKQQKRVEQQNSPALPEPKKANTPTRDALAEKAAVGGGTAAQAIRITNPRIARGCDSEG